MPKSEAVNREGIQVANPNSSVGKYNVQRIDDDG